MRIDVDAVLFDNDGVLVDSHAQVEQAWTQVTTEFGLDIDEMLDELIGVRAVDTLSRYLPAAQVTAACSRLEEVEVELAVKTIALAGATRLIAQLPDGAWTVATSATRLLAVARWEGAGIPVPRAEVSVTADDVTKGKPHPEPFLEAARRLGVDPERCVVFEDSAAGGTAARASGATVVAVGGQPWPFEPVARVADLRQVSAVTNPRGALSLELSAPT